MHGDQLLKGVASRLADTLRLNDTIARIGGDEFTVMLTNVTDSLGVMAIADKLLNTLTDPFLLNDRMVYVTCSIGIAIADNDDTNTAELLKQADAALYRAKKAGRNQYTFYTAELDHEAKLHVHIRQSLMEPERGCFRVVYQPQVDAKTDQITGLEALTRWQHPEVEPIGPDVFIRIIEDSGLIEEFSTWLFDEVFKTMDSWRLKGLDLDGIKISINLSAKQFRDHNLADYVLKRCLSYRLKPEWITLELTETAIVEDPLIASKTLQKLTKMGFTIALDDFGTGFSSLVHLRNMPLSIVKIDRSFVKDVVHDQEDGKIVQAILALANTLGLSVVAEGVDNSDVKAWLIKNNCFLQQGYYFFKPLECSEIETSLVRNPVDTVVPINGKVS